MKIKFFDIGKYGDVFKEHEYGKIIDLLKHKNSIFLEYYLYHRYFDKPFFYFYRFIPYLIISIILYSIYQNILFLFIFIVCKAA